MSIDVNSSHDARKICGAINHGRFIVVDRQETGIETARYIFKEIETGCKYINNSQVEKSLWNIGDVVIASIEPVHLSNEYNSYARYLESIGIRYESRFLDVQLVAKGEQIYGLHMLLRDYLTGLLSDYFSRDSLPLILGVTLGDDSLFSKEQVDAIRSIGITHLIAVSGANFSLVVGVFGLTFNKLLTVMQVRSRLFLLTFIGTIYLTLVGWTNYPALRAYIFLVIRHFQQLTGRKLPKSALICLGLMIIFILFPYAYKSVSLQLSFLAWVLVNLILGKVVEKFERYLPGLAHELLAAAFGTLLILPVSLIYFSEVNLYSVLFNALLVPLFNLFNVAALAMLILVPLANLAIITNFYMFCAAAMEFITVKLMALIIRLSDYSIILDVGGNLGPIVLVSFSLGCLIYFSFTLRNATTHTIRNYYF